jgi:hypothetical protein
LLHRRPDITPATLQSQSTFSASGFEENKAYAECIPHNMYIGRKE